MILHFYGEFVLCLEFLYLNTIPVKIYQTSFMTPFLWPRTGDGSLRSSFLTYGLGHQHKGWRLNWWDWSPLLQKWLGLSKTEKWLGLSNGGEIWISTGYIRSEGKYVIKLEWIACGLVLYYLTGLRPRYTELSRRWRPEAWKFVKTRQNDKFIKLDFSWQVLVFLSPVFLDLTNLTKKSPVL